MRQLIHATCIAAMIGLGVPALSVPLAAQVKDEVKDAGKDAGDAGKKAGEAGKDAGKAAAKAGKSVGKAGKKVGSSVKDAAKGVAKDTKKAVVGDPPKGSTGLCKDGTYTSSQEKQGACSGHGGIEKWL